MRTIEMVRTDAPARPQLSSDVLGYRPSKITRSTCE
jgi:hypothetical protein